MSASNSFLSTLLDFFARLFKPPAPPVTPTPPESGELTPLSPRVLVIVYNPVVDATTGKKLIQEMNWNDPDTLTAGYIADQRECSGGLVNYQIVERIEINAFPKKESGLVYQPNQYVSAYRAGGAGLDPGLVDYDAIITEFNLLARVANREIDEVWIWNFPGAGFYESTLAGKGAFYCNSEPRPHTDQCPRKFVIMGFSYERGIGEMLENLGHRTESVLARVYGSEDFLAKTYNASARNPELGARARNAFERFLLFDMIAPGKAQCGNVHFAPNSVRDYDWGNPTPVTSYCDDWDHFPEFPGLARTVDANEWGSGEIRAHHKWWMKHFPRIAGVTNGIANNWWKYIIDPNTVK